MMALITAVIQLIIIIFNTMAEKDKKEKARKDALLTDWHKTVASGDVSAINAMVERVRS